MTLDHFGKPISHYLYQCFGFFSAAEGFFFLSGFVGILAATSKSPKDPRQSWMRSRALKTWKYHMVTLIALCLVACKIPSLSHFFESIYQHPLQGTVLSLILVNTPEWLDVLPLYVLFLILASYIFPQFVKAKGMGKIGLLWLPSFALWILAQFGLRDALNGIFPGWVHHGDFDPFAWQFVYFTGASVAAWWKRARAQESAGNPTAVNAVKKLTPAILILLVFGFLWSHQFIALPMPCEFLTSKVHLGALRFLNFFAFMLAICWIVRNWPSLLDFRATNLLGRHSLDVYTAHIVLIYIWFTVPGSIRYHGPWNIIVPIAACLLLWLLSRCREPKVQIK